jgi:hypothetical protein
MPVRPLNNFLIITVHLNNSKGFKSTFDSVVPLLNYSNSVKWIIKDGNSNSSEFAKIKEYLVELETRKYRLVQKADKGIYDAMNQSLEYVENNLLVLFLNSGDQLTKNFIDNYKRFSKIEADILYSDTKVGNKIVKAPDNLDFAFFLGKTINHQSYFIKSELLKKHPFNNCYSIVADWVQLMEIFRKEKPVIQKLNYPISEYEGGGISEKRDDLRIQQRAEYLKINYSEWELNSIIILSRMRQRNWYGFILKALDSPKRSIFLNYISKIN